jgi:chromosome segregation ATPase
MDYQRPSREERRLVRWCRRAVAKLGEEHWQLATEHADQQQWIEELEGENRRLREQNAQIRKTMGEFQRRRNVLLEEQSHSDSSVVDAAERDHLVLENEKLQNMVGRLQKQCDRAHANNLKLLEILGITEEIDGDAEQSTFLNQEEAAELARVAAELEGFVDDGPVADALGRPTVDPYHAFELGEEDEDET